MPRENVPLLRTPVSAGWLAVLLGALAMLGPFSVDAYLPAFPDLMRSLDANHLEVQQTLAVYMLAFSVMNLWHGALSDAFGRRGVVLIALAVFVVATFGCAAAHSIHYLWGFRALQGLSSGAGMVVGRAMIRDLYDETGAQRLMSSTTMIFSIAPAIAPIIGGWIVTGFGWRAIFLGLLLYSVLLFGVCTRYLPESLPRHQRQIFSFDFLWQSYRSVFQSGLFYLKAGTVAANFAGLFLYVSSAPVFITRHLKLGAGDFGWQFIPMVGGIFFGAMAANRIAGKLAIDRQIDAGFAFMLTATIFNFSFHLLQPPGLPWSVLPLFFYAFGMSLIAPGATIMVLDLFPAIRGVAASCQSFFVTLGGAIVAGLVAPAISDDMRWLAGGQCALAITGFVLWQTGRFIRHQRAERVQNAWESVE